jgi:hypothetical protein
LATNSNETWNDCISKNLLMEKLISSSKFENSLIKFNENPTLEEKFKKNHKVMKLRQQVLSQRSFEYLSNLSPGEARSPVELLNWVEETMKFILSEIFIPFKEMIIYFKYIDSMNEMDKELNKKTSKSIFVMLNLLQDKALDKLQNISQEETLKRKQFNKQIIQIQHSINQLKL